MKFLSHRDEFLQNKSNLLNQIQSSTIISEQYFQNDIRFGDSLFGRLINSTIQSVVTGVKSITIPFLLKSLESQLRLMVDHASFEQINKEYPNLFLKSNLERIKTVCDSQLSESEKMRILIGWDGKTPMYDKNNPYGDVPGLYENRKLRSSLVQEVYDDIRDPNKRPNLEKSFNPNIIKGFLDSLSNFMGDLRKLTSNIDISEASPSDTPFENKDLIQSLQKLSQINLTRESRFMKPMKYSNFIYESNQNLNDKISNLERLQKISPILLTKSKSGHLENLIEYKEFKKIYQSLNDREREILKNNNLLSTLDEIFGDGVTENYFVYIKSTLENLNELYTTSTSTGLPIITSGATPSSSVTTGPTTSTTGTTSSTSGFSTTGITGASTSKPSEKKPENVKEVWSKFFNKVDKIFPAKMTQDDINQLKSFSTKNVDLTSSITKDPNPLFRIIRIFENANSVFTTNEIPSGRSGGEVWPITYNRYQYVGGGSPGGHEKPGFGPWVHKPLFKEWYHGVMELMSKPEFAEIFPNVEATNLKKESFDYIFEKDINSTERTEVVSRKLILQDFMVDMLNIKNQGDFSDFASRAMKRYFGLNVEPSKLIGNKNVDIQQPEIDKEDVESKSFIWENFKKTSFDPKDVNKFYVFSIEDQRKNKGSESYKLIFVRPIKLTGKLVEVKFTFNNQEEANIFMNDSSFSEYQKVDFSCEKETNNIYYGVMLNDFKDGIKICYSNVGDSSSNSFIADNLLGEPKKPGTDVFEFSRHKIKLLSGEEKSIDRFRLVMYDDKKTKQQVNKDIIKVYNEKSDEKLRDLPTSTSSKLFDALSNLGKDPKFKFWS